MKCLCQRLLHFARFSKSGSQFCVLDLRSPIKMLLINSLIGGFYVPSSSVEDFDWNNCWITASLNQTDNDRLHFTALYVMADFFQNVLLDAKIDFRYLIESLQFWKRFYIGEIGARFFAFFVHLNSALSKFLTYLFYWSDAN